jgi:3-oxoacyl-[acyl-carrier protein] reductase
MSSTPRTAIVTGGARGIGAAVVRRLAADGMAVAVLDLDEAACRPVVAEVESVGGRSLAVGVDVADEAGVTAAVERVAVELGSPTVLVNNAGITRDNLLFRMDVADWDAVIGVHLRGAFLMSRAVQTHMTAAGEGRIITMSSTSALGNRGQVNYAAAKGGLESLTRTLAIELGKFGITANAIAPGYIDTPMLSATAERLGMAYDDFLAMGAKSIPVGRWGTPDDIAQAVSFFADPRTGYVNGQVLAVAGGPSHF